MKKILFLFLGITLLSLSSCFKIDNWDAPDCTFHGTVYDEYTKEPILSSQDDWQFRIWERSWKGHEGGATTHQDLRIKQDGTYQNTKLFAGTYDMHPYNGPFWPMDTLRGVVLKGTTKMDFTVTPYLQILDFSYQIVEIRVPGAAPIPGLTFKCKVKAPILEKDGVALPNLYEVKAFISRTQWCGEGSNSRISEYDNDVRVRPNRPWVDNGNNSETTAEFTIGPIQVKKGYTYWVRMGAAVNDSYRKFNYSDIQRVVIP